MFKCIECDMEDVEAEGDFCDDCMYECEEDEDMFEDED